jgi:probable rRNA maturation factor
MITLQNKQRAVRVNTQALKKDAQAILGILDYADFDLAIVLVDNPTIHHYNKTYRGKDKPTDILSFSYHPSLRPGERIEAEDEDDKNIGDLIISPEYVVAQLPELETTLDERMRVLLVHGICHLRGYDHEIDEDYEIMKTEEERLLDELRKNNVIS